MSRVSILALLIAGIFAFFAGSSGCTGKARYQDTVSANRSNIQQLRLGMSHLEVSSIMGEGEMVKYRRIRLNNPWRSESFVLQEGDQTKVAILYYLTESQRRWRNAEDPELTPVVLENNQVVGWGWSYLRRNLDRYAISTPLEQQ